MALENFAIEARRRSGWEALDLGLVMLRQWRGPVYRAWFATWGLFALALSPLLWWSPVWFGVLVWWLKPLFDRVLLKVYAEATFGAAPTVKEVWRALPGLIRRSGMFAGLTWGRINTARSFLLPIVQLEGQRGREGRARRKLLSRRSLGYAVWLTLACVHFVVFLELSGLLLVEILLPSEAPDLFEWGAYFKGEQSRWAIVFANLAWLAAESMVEPYYVAAGFSLYLARRSELEGWDIEVAFRRLSLRKAAEHAAPLLRVLVAGLFGLLLATAAPQAGWAGEAVKCAPAAPAPSAKATPARETLRKVLQDPVFGCSVPDTKWERRSTDDPKPSPLPAWLRMLGEFGKVLARLLQGAVYVVGAGLIIFLAVLLYRRRNDWLGGPRAAALPETLFGLDVRPESLPADVGAAARALLAGGDVAGSLSLLYRVALSSLLHRRHIDFRSGDTEADCLARTRSKVATGAYAYFSRLLDAWKLTAYAHQPPAAAEIGALCDDWATHFGAGA
ncbi:membrane protein [Sulfurimicrobium lacus]|uniref:Membrane protein n=1 Tax=Sulfurimicrobium lacus TaxID=2715678 RepID=A0A6F8VAI1_9PROT|nr:hypothetical protein [Sulfurimicrobium lacus]BCB25765.1 membrane protein [Sulfurimicrobium lacus]